METQWSKWFCPMLHSSYYLYLNESFTENSQRTFHQISSTFSPISITNSVFFFIKKGITSHIRYTYYLFTYMLRYSADKYMGTLDNGLCWVISYSCVSHIFVCIFDVVVRDFPWWIYARCIYPFIHTNKNVCAVFFLFFFHLDFPTYAKKTRPREKSVFHFIYFVCYML